MTETPDVPPLYDGQQFELKITGTAEVIRGDDNTEKED